MKAQLIESAGWGWNSWCGDCNGDGYTPGGSFMGRTGDCNRGWSPGSGRWEFVPP